MFDLLPLAWDLFISSRMSCYSRKLARFMGGENKPISAQASPFWAAIIGNRHCARSRKEWGSV